MPSLTHLLSLALALTAPLTTAHPTTNPPTTPPTSPQSLALALTPPAPGQEYNDPHRTTCQTSYSIQGTTYTITGWSWNSTAQPQPADSYDAIWNWGPKAESIWESAKAFGRVHDYKIAWEPEVDGEGYWKFVVKFRLRKEKNLVSDGLNGLLGIPVDEHWRWNPNRAVVCDTDHQARARLRKKVKGSMKHLFDPVLVPAPASGSD